MEQKQIEMMHENQEELCVCPTFNGYSSDRLAEIAGRVADEFSEEKAGDLREDCEDDDGFEFSLVRDESEVFYDGQIGPIFPTFNRNILFHDSEVSDKHPSNEDEIVIPLKKLFIREREERDTPSSSSSSSSSEADELESISPGTYCVWRPKVPESPCRCKKSKSTGSASKRWKFLDLLRRSNSDGKEKYVFLTPKDREEKPENKNERSNKSFLKENSGKAKAKGLAASPSLSAHEAFYARNRAIKQGDKKKSYLPYRQNLVGFFANVNGSGTAFHPF